MKKQNLSVLDLLDRLLAKGAVVKGDIVLTVADIDLVYLNLEFLLASISTLQKGIGETGENNELNFAVDELNKNKHAETKKTDQKIDKPIINAYEPEFVQNINEIEAQEKKPSKIKMDEKNVEKGLAKLVLVLVDLLRKLMERQAIRRMELGQLTPLETEKIGRTFLLMDQRIKQLKKFFNLEDEDLNLDLGPLGKLI